LTWLYRYGSFDFMKQSSGLICCYSLKNPSHPEYTFTTESGVMALDFHPQHSSLLAVGLYDGTVMVFDIRNKVRLAAPHLAWVAAVHESVAVSRERGGSR